MVYRGVRLAPHGASGLKYESGMLTMEQLGSRPAWGEWIEMVLSHTTTPRRDRLAPHGASGLKWTYPVSYTHLWANRFKRRALSAGRQPQVLCGKSGYPRRSARPVSQEPCRLVLAAGGARVPPDIAHIFEQAHATGRHAQQLTQRTQAA